MTKKHISRVKERAFILPIIAFILLTPPILLVFNSKYFFYSVPIVYIYSFFVWIILIILGAILSSKLQTKQ